VMFGRSGAISLAPGDPAEDEAGPYALLGSALDDLVSSGVLPAARRPGAELNTWVTVHGFARLCLDGAAKLPPGSARTDALESLLDFTVAGICGWLPWDGVDPSTKAGWTSPITRTSTATATVVRAAAAAVSWCRGRQTTPVGENLPF
jgi:hypothetical protein